jgi:hypothetical protein
MRTGYKSCWIARGRYVEQALLELQEASRATTVAGYPLQLGQARFPVYKDLDSFA